jgi:hypothetical protein
MRPEVSLHPQRKSYCLDRAMKRSTATPYSLCWRGLVGLVSVVTVAALLIFCANNPKPHIVGAIPDGTPRGRPDDGYDKVEVVCSSGRSTIAGRVTYSDTLGHLHPLSDVSFFVETHGTVHCSPEPSKVSVTPDEEGRFEFSVILWSDGLVYYLNSRAIAWDSVDDLATITLRAPGCNDFTIQFDGRLVGRAAEEPIIMKCPGRPDGKTGEQESGLSNHRLHLTSGGGLAADTERPRSPAAGEAERYTARG